MSLNVLGEHPDAFTTGSSGDRKLAAGRRVRGRCVRPSQHLTCHYQHRGRTRPTEKARVFFFCPDTQVIPRCNACRPEGTEFTTVSFRQRSGLEGDAARHQMQSSFRRFWCHMSGIFRMGFFHKLLFYSDYSSDEMILHLWEWSQDRRNQHNPEEAGLVFFKLKFSCDCLVKCPCFALWGEVDLCRLELPEHKLHNSCCLQATSKVCLETRADAPASSLTSGFISAWILCPLCWQWTVTAHTKPVKLNCSFHT